MEKGQENVEILWKEVMAKVEERLNDNRAYDIWLRPVKIKGISANKVQLEIPGTTFEKGFIPYIGLIREIFEDIAGWKPEIEISYTGEEKRTTPPSPTPTIEYETSLNPSYTFDNFVVGPKNQLAHAAAQAVAQSPGIAYNPLFLYGGFGLGKTHLMQAIVHFIQERDEKNILYLPADVYLNEFIQSIKNKTTHLFRQRFRKLDFLLIDDIHFIAGKEGTQEEFFHTFNFLYDQRKQIILSSDRPPKEISFLEKRLVSRFEWGLLVEVLPPDFETRVAILKKKCEIKKIVLDDEIIYYITENVKDNVRILEGVLNRLFALSTLLSQEIDKKVVDEIIDGEYYNKRVVVTLDSVMSAVCDYFKIKEDDIVKNTRIKNILLPRQIGMFLGRELTGSSLHSIAIKFGGKDHTTVLYAYKKIKTLYQNDQYIKGIIDEIRSTLER
ncbi:MAG: chromosomal replication initiator protein DnaA [Candidatus Ratteibacteria bacterium]|nr:chromosomal replication initiator protein DnaA [Candidatus Ratteibacteria bacterium]